MPESAPGGQSLDAQVDALVGAGAIEVFMEHASGATQARARWQDCLEHLQPGNILVVTDLTRLGRSTADLSTTSAHGLRPSFAASLKSVPYASARDSFWNNI